MFFQSPVVVHKWSLGDNGCPSSIFNVLKYSFSSHLTLLPASVLMSCIVQHYLLSIKNVCGLATLKKLNNIANFITCISTLKFIFVFVFLSHNIFCKSDQTKYYRKQPSRGVLFFRSSSDFQYSQLIILFLAVSL